MQDILQYYAQQMQNPQIRQFLENLNQRMASSWDQTFQQNLQRFGNPMVAQRYTNQMFSQLPGYGLARMYNVVKNIPAPTPEDIQNTLSQQSETPALTPNNPEYWSFNNRIQRLFGGPREKKENTPSPIPGPAPKNIEQELVNQAPQPQFPNWGGSYFRPQFPGFGGGYFNPGFGYIQPQLPQQTPEMINNAPQNPQQAPNPQNPIGLWPAPQMPNFRPQTQQMVNEATQTAKNNALAMGFLNRLI